MANNELQLLNPDQELALAIKNGDITKEEVERIWNATTDMSANTPIATRRAVLLMKQAGSFEKAWPIFYKEVMRQNSEIMAAFNRDESKFSHLVAGTEAIVKTMQNLNPLQQRLDDMARMMFEMREELRELRSEREEKKVAAIEEAPLPEGVRRPVEGVDVDDYEAKAEQARKDSIGSAWAK